MNVIPAQTFAAHRGKGEAVFGTGIDQFVIHRLRTRQNPQPAKGVDAFELLAFGGGDRLAADTVESVTACNVGAADLLPLAIF